MTATVNQWHQTAGRDFLLPQRTVVGTSNVFAKRKKPSKAHPKMSRRSKVGFQAPGERYTIQPKYSTARERVRGSERGLISNVTKMKLFQCVLLCRCIICCLSHLHCIIASKHSSVELVLGMHIDTHTHTLPGVRDHGHCGKAVDF